MNSKATQKHSVARRVAGAVEKADAATSLGTWLVQHWKTAATFLSGAFSGTLAAMLKALGVVTAAYWKVAVAAVLPASVVLVPIMWLLRRTRSTQASVDPTLQDTAPAEEAPTEVSLVPQGDAIVRTTPLKQVVVCRVNVDPGLDLTPPVVRLVLLVFNGSGDTIEFRPGRIRNAVAILKPDETALDGLAVVPDRHGNECRIAPGTSGHVRLAIELRPAGVLERVRELLEDTERWGFDLPHAPITFRLGKVEYRLPMWHGVNVQYGRHCSEHSSLEPDDLTHAQRISDL